MTNPQPKAPQNSPASSPAIAPAVAQVASSPVGPVGAVGPGHIRVQLLSNPLFLSGVRELVASVARRCGFHEMNCSKIALAVDEALCNIMRHGYDKRLDGMIWVDVWPTPTGSAEPMITIRIEDEAKHVEPCNIKGRALDDIKPGGLGVHIIKQVMDHVVYEKRDPVGMRLTISKTQRPGDQSSSQVPTPARSCDASGSGCGCAPDNSPAQQNGGTHG
jgi:serine/threonine-protein kinase RsbW